MRLALFGAVLIVAGALLTMPAVAKEGVRAKLDEPVVLDASPGKTITVAWRLIDEDGRPFGASGIQSIVGVHGGGDDVELYAPAARRRDIVEEHALEHGDGPVLMRWVRDELWPVVAAEIAPRAAVLVDLLEHDDPRARREAERELRRR